MYTSMGLHIVAALAEHLCDFAADEDLHQLGVELDPGLLPHGLVALVRGHGPLVGAVRGHGVVVEQIAEALFVAGHFLDVERFGSSANGEDDKDASGSHSQSDSKSEVIHSSNQPVQQLDQSTDQETLRLLKQKEEELSVMTGKVILLQQRIKHLVRKNKHLVDLVARNIGAGDSSAVVSRNEVFKSQIVESINTILHICNRVCLRVIQVGARQLHIVWYTQT